MKVPCRRKRLQLHSEKLRCTLMLVSDANKSSAEVCTTIPPKSVRWVQLQYSQPSALPEGGGELTQPSSDHALVRVSQ